MCDNNDPAFHSFAYDFEGNTSGPHSEWPLDKVEGLRFDTRGNLLDDGRYVYAWDGHNRLIDWTPYNLAKPSEDRVLFDDLSRNPFAFGSIIDDAFAGLDFGPTRMLDPRMGRWLICDPTEEQDGGSFT